MGKPVPEAERLREPLIVMTTRAVRRTVERLAKEGRVSVSEIGRRALTNYLQQRGSGSESETPGEGAP